MMLLAALNKEMTLAPEVVLMLNVVGFGLLFAGILVYRAMLRRVESRGGLVRTDLFALPDMLVAATLCTLLVLLLLLQWFGGEPAKPPTDPDASVKAVKGMQIISGALQFALPVAAILALLISRGVSLPQLFGLTRVNAARAIATAVGLLVLLLPVFMIVTTITFELLNGHAEQQEMVKVFQSAAKSGKREIIWQVIVAAVVIAPISEELLFRGYFYPVLKRFAGAVPAAFAVSALFGAIHNNALGMPGLTVLALALTLAYEWSGSILVPIFMHACFNAMTLVFMWVAIERGWMP